MNTNIFRFVVIFQSYLFLFIINLSYGQSGTITGKLTDQNKAGVPSASILLLALPDSAFVKGIVSDVDGVFAFNQVKKGNYLLLVQHLVYGKQYQNVSVNGTSADLGSITLMEKENELGEVEVIAKRPIVSMKDNVLTYNATAVSGKFVRNNALEVLGDVPGLLLKDESLQLIGASQLNIAINGKPSSMTMEQVLSMLKSMPNTCIKEIQVMYAPPAKYNVKGSLINIILTKAGEDELNGSLSLGYRQRRAPGANTNLSLQFASHKLEMSMLYTGNYNEANTVNQMDIHHVYRDTLYVINQRFSGPRKSFDHNFQLNSTYNIDENQNLSMVYSGNFTDNDSKRTSQAMYTSVKGTSIEDDNTSEVSTETFHNLKLDYSLNNKLNIGVDYTFYQDPSTQNYQVLMDGNVIDYKTSSRQTVNKWMGYINHTYSFNDQSSVNYGANYAYSNNENYYKYYDSDNGTYAQNEDQSTLNEFREFTLSGFAGSSKQFGSRFNISLSVKAEYDKMIKDTASLSKKLWGKCNIYPSLNLSYTVDTSSNHIFQLSVKSFVNYPTYWEISPATWYANQYMLVKGNPEIQPSQTYETELSYIFHHKYVFMVSYEYTAKMISQIPYASDETFNTIARNENLDFGSNLTAALVLPFSLGSNIQSNPTIGAFHRKMKRDGTEGQSFDRSSNSFFLQMDNAYTISKKLGLKVTLSGYYSTKMIQTIYDIKKNYDVSCGLSCNLMKDKALLTLKVKDIFASNAPVTAINFQNQHSVYHFDWDIRQLLLTFKYSFGKPLKDKSVSVDKSRFKRMD